MTAEACRPIINEKHESKCSILYLKRDFKEGNIIFVKVMET